MRCLTPKAYADEYQLSLRTVNRQIHAGAVEASRIGQQWGIFLPDLPPPRVPEDEKVRTLGVYFARAGGLVKIGVSRRVVKRVRGLQWASEEPLTPVGFIPIAGTFGDAMRAEHALHVQFAALRQHGEWFTESPELTAFMEEHCAPWPVPHAG